MFVGALLALGGLLMKFKDEAYMLTERVLTDVGEMQVSHVVDKGRNIAQQSPWPPDKVINAGHRNDDSESTHG